MLHRKRKRYGKIKVFFCILFLLLIGFTIFFECFTEKLQDKIISSRANIIAEKYITDAVADVIDDYENIGYDCINIEDSNNGVKYVSTNSAKINEMKASIDTALSKKLSDLTSAELKVPLGDLTGLTFLSDLGPDIPFSYNLTGSAVVKLNSSLTSAGINQTVHHITMTVKSKIFVITTRESDFYCFKTDYEVCQTVIVGSVPSFYDNRS
ncbi:MAG: sporulation protein YunB [Acutalibacteraceae bacterium]